MVAASFVAIANGSPVNRQGRAAEPLDILGAVTRGVGFNRRPNQGIKKYVIMHIIISISVNTLENKILPLSQLTHIMILLQFL